MTTEPKSDIQGEGNYTAARNFDQAERDFVKSGKVKDGARAAEQALDGPEGAALEEARIQSAKGDPLKTGEDKSFAAKP
jgi:hypothetical protein